MGEDRLLLVREEFFSTIFRNLIVVNSIYFQCELFSAEILKYHFQFALKMKVTPVTFCFLYCV